jgi:hypothetical protein
LYVFAFFGSVSSIHFRIDTAGTSPLVTNDPSRMSRRKKYRDESRAQRRCEDFGWSRIFGPGSGPSMSCASSAPVGLNAMASVE